MVTHFPGSAGLKYTQIAAPGGSYRDQYGGVASYGDMHGQVQLVAYCCRSSMDERRRIRALRAACIFHLCTY